MRFQILSSIPIVWLLGKTAAFGLGGAHRKANLSFFQFLLCSESGLNRRIIITYSFLMGDISIQERKGF